MRRRRQSARRKKPKYASHSRAQICFLLSSSIFPFKQFANGAMCRRQVRVRRPRPRWRRRLQRGWPSLPTSTPNRLTTKATRLVCYRLLCLGFGCNSHFLFSLLYVCVCLFLCLCHARLQRTRTKRSTRLPMTTTMTFPMRGMRRQTTMTMALKRLA